MEEQGVAGLHCDRCRAERDAADNFCRACGADLSERYLPAVRDNYDVVPWQAAVPAVVRGAAVVAAGTIAEALLRRLVGRALRVPGSRARRPAANVAVVERDESLAEDTQLISETLVFRRVRQRR